MVGRNFEFDRREYMASLSGVAIGSILSTGFVAGQTSTVIGDFEDGFDGWKTNGRTELSRTDESSSPWAVSSGNHALVVSTSTDPQPMIERRVNGLPSRYLLADVSTPDMGGDFSRTTIELRLRYNRSGSGGNGGNGDTNNGSERGKTMVTVASKQIPFGYSGTLAWDLSDLDGNVRENATRVQYVWYRSDTQSDSNPRGNGSGKGYDGTVTLDNVRFSDETELFQRARLAHHINDLRSRHGDYQYEFETFENGKEIGSYVFADGTVIQSSFEHIANREFELLIGDRSFRIVLGS